MLVCHPGAMAYPYTAHLLEFERRSSRRHVPEWLRTVSTPLVRDKWSRVLESHPDSAFRDYILRGISEGFHIGFNHKIHACKQASSNMHSALENPDVIQEYLEKEVAKGRVVGPIDLDLAPPSTQISPFGVIPKSSQPGKWRLIVDLSSP